MIPPLAAAPATERSERVGEEAEESEASIVHLRACASVRVCVVYRARCFYASVRLFTPDMVH
uniref:hypothetical protein n=1 Tax=Escherichia coli TaxID=562 RepID=UPI00388E92DF